MAHVDRECKGTLEQRGLVTHVMDDVRKLRTDCRNKARRGANSSRLFDLTVFDQSLAIGMELLWCEMKKRGSS